MLLYYVHLTFEILASELLLQMIILQF